VKKILSVLFFLPLFAGAQTQLSFTPLANNDYTGPGRGASNWNGIPWDNSQGVQINGQTSGSNQYNRFNWYDFENNTQGSYNFATFDAWINQAIDNGRTFSFGIMTYYSANSAPGWGGAGVMSYPIYLHNLMQSDVSGARDWETSSTSTPANTWVPNWNSQYYLPRFQALLNAIAAHIASGSHSGKNYRDVIQYIDIRGYGDFGEWHMYNVLDQTPSGRVATSATLIGIIDAHKTAFPDYPLCIMEQVWDHGNPSSGNIPLDVGYYAATTSNAYGPLGWRCDNIGNAAEDNRLANNPYNYNGLNFSTAILNAYKFAPVVGEPVNSGSQFNNGSDLHREDTLYHRTEVGNGNYPNNDATNATLRTNVSNASREQGYNIKLTGGSMTSILSSNGVFNITISWNNSGLSPTYDEWKVRYELRTGGVGSSVIWSGYSTFQPRPLLPGSTITQSDNFTLGAVANQSANLYMIIQDSTGYRSPMPLMISGRGSDGSYLIRSGIQINQVANEPPISCITGTGSITLPTSSVALSGTCSSDADGSIASFSWSQVSGPNTASIGTPTASTSTMSGLTAGTYVFQLVVTDNLGATGTSQKTVNVNNSNIPPTAAITGSGNIQLPTSSTALSGTSSTDPDGSIASYSWTFVSGPTTPTVGTPSASTSTISGMTTAGTYIIQLVVTDNLGATGTTQKSISVASANISPVAQAQGSSSITLPVNSVVADGTTSFDPDGTIASYAWAQLSGGPNTATNSNPSSAQTTFGGLIQGTYNFQLTVTDNQGATGKDTLTVVVNAAGTDIHVFTSQTPNLTVSNDGQGLTLGMKFRSSIDAWVKGVRFYKVVGNNGVHQGMLYDNAGKLLAQAIFTTESSAGWQDVTFTSPVLIRANTTYMAAYFSPGGTYTYTTGGLTSAVINNTVMSLGDGQDGFNGMYQYGSTPIFPQSHSTVGGGKVNYWVDVTILANVGSYCGGNCLYQINYNKVR
jgi:hypothetical protein